MARRWGFGPVFAFECVAAARRGRLYVARVALLLALLAGLGLIWLPSGYLVRLGQMAMLGRRAFLTVVTIQMAAVLLVAPAAAAGAICIDKARGTLLHVMVTDLRDGEIVLGKLAARLAPIASLWLCGVPVLALCSLLGGVDGRALAGACLATAGVAAVASALALALSVWSRRIHQALLPAYLTLLLWLGLYPIAEVLRFSRLGVSWRGVDRLLLLTNPFGILLDPDLPGPRAGLREQAAFFLGTSLLAAAFAAVAARYVRPVAVGQSSRPARRGPPGMPARVVGLLPEPPLDGNPVLWREWHRKRPSRWTGRFWTAYAAISGLASAGVLAAFYRHPAGDHWALAAEVNALGVTLGLLLLSVSAASSLAEERDRGSLDTVLATPLATWQVVVGKWWGTFAMVPRLLIFPAWVACGLALVTGKAAGAAWMIALILAYAAAITSIGLAAATWVPRAGRAVVNSVLAYLLLTLGSFVAFEAGSVLPPPRGLPPDLGEKLLLSNPYYGVLMTTEHTGSPGPGDYGTWDRPFDFLAREPEWALVWVVIYSATSAALVAATVATFDRCLGRVPERRIGRPASCGHPETLVGSARRG